MDFGEWMKNIRNKLKKRNNRTNSNSSNNTTAIA